jgi:transcription elongation factor GreB
MERNNYITPQGHLKLVDEFETLLKVERPEITKVIQWAAGNGDRSENADYIYGRRRLREIDRRLRFLKNRLELSLIVDPNQIKSQKVQFGATVLTENEAGESKTFTIVGVDEVDTAKGRISWQSPIGKNLIGKEEGDEVSVKVPAGEMVLEIVSIIYQPIE